jgi:hypothetical protein
MGNASLVAGRALARRESEDFFILRVVWHLNCHS